MIRQYLNIVFQFVFFVLLQGLILNQVDLFGFINAYLYILVLILLPVEFNRNLGLIIGFFLGLSVDLFSSSWGMHTSACVTYAFLRPFLLRLLSPRDGYVAGVVPNMSYMGINWFLSYAAFSIIIHHLFLYYVEVFRFAEFFSTMGRALASSLFTFALVILVQFLTYRQIRAL